MKLRKLSLLISAALYSSLTFANPTLEGDVYDQYSIDFNNYNDVPYLANDAFQLDKTFRLQDINGNTAYIEAKINSAKIGKIKMADGLIYNRISLPDAGMPNEVGKPNLMGYQQLVRIPNNSSANIIIDNIEWSKPITDIVVDPVQQPSPDVVEQNGIRPEAFLKFSKSQSAYGYATDIQLPPVQISDEINIRGKKYIILSYKPVDFDPINNSVRFAHKVNFHLDYSSNNNDTKNNDRFDNLGNDDNSNDVIDIRPAIDRQNTTSSDQNSNQNLDRHAAQLADYLIITADRFREAIEPLAAWKRKKGYRVYVATLTEIGNTQGQIKDFIKNAYTHGTMTSYVLLVGDHEDIPAYQVVGHPYHGPRHVWHTDFDYALVDGNDSYPDLIIGRLPADTAEQVTRMVNRSISYDKSPVRSDRYSHVLLSGLFQDKNADFKADRLFMEGLHRAADFLGGDYKFFNNQVDMYNKGYTIHTALQWDPDLSEDLTYYSRYGGLDYGQARITPPANVPDEWKNQGYGDKTNIQTTINSSVGFVIHRDHGYGDGSGWAEPQFTNFDTYGLNNNLLPFVFSFDCATGWFDGQDSFAESWLLNPNGGAIGFTGAARVSFSGYNDLLLSSVLDGFWDDYDNSWSSDIYKTSWRPAQALTRAKLRLFGQYGTNDSYAIATARFFNWLGDPELELRTALPYSLNVTYPKTLVPKQENSFDVKVQHDNHAAEKVRVAITDYAGNVYLSTTNKDGIAHFSITPVTNKLNITASEHNAITFEGLIQSPIAEKPVTTTPNPINVNVGEPTMTIAPNSWATLDGRQSSYPENQNVTFHWEQISGPTTRIDYADTLFAYAYIPQGAEQLVFKLTITEPSGKSASATKTVIVH